MTERRSTDNPGAPQFAAPLTNVTMAAAALGRAHDRSRHMPGMVGITGRAGLGKTLAAIYCANRFGAVYVELRQTMSIKSMLGAVLAELAIKPFRTTDEMFLQVTDELGASRRPLIIDEADYLVARRDREGRCPMLETVRSIYDRSQSAVMLIGEEDFQAKVKRASERFHSRVLAWQPARKTALEDARKLARYYAPRLELADDLLAQLIADHGGNARLICIGIDDVRKHCEDVGVKRMDLAGWSGTTASPKRGGPRLVAGGEA